VVGQQSQASSAGAAREPEVPYRGDTSSTPSTPLRFLRSIARRDRLFEDVAADHELKERLIRSLDDAPSSSSRSASQPP